MAGGPSQKRKKMFNLLNCNHHRPNKIERDAAKADDASRPGSRTHAFAMVKHEWARVPLYRDACADF